MSVRGWSAGLLMAGVLGARAQAVTAVTSLDLSQFATTWYEVAKYPVKSEKKCVRDGLYLFASGDKAGRLEEVQSCVLGTGFADVHNANLRLKDKKVRDGRLQTTVLYLFHRQQWVLALGADYGWALMGSPNRKHLWVLSKTFELQPQVLAEVEARASALGFDPAKLVAVPQTREGRVR